MSRSFKRRPLRFLAVLLPLALCIGCAVPAASTPVPTGVAPSTPPSATPTLAPSSTSAPTPTQSPSPSPAATPTTAATPTIAGTPTPTPAPTLSPDLLFQGVGQTRNNRGSVLWDGKYYFLGPTSTGGIFRMNADGSGLAPLTTQRCEWLNVVDGWVFYVDMDDGQSLYRMKTDGSGKAKVSAVPTLSLLAADGWLYANQGSDGQPEVLYRMRADGSARTRFSKVSESAFIVECVGGWFYYIGFGADYDRNFYRSRGDGTGRTKISDEWLLAPVIWNGSVYFQRRFKRDDGEWDVDPALYRMKLDGTGTTRLFERPDLYYLRIEAGYAYYANYAVTFGHFCRVDLSDPSFAEQELTLGVPDFLSFAGDKLFTSFDDGAHLGWSNPDLSDSAVLVGG